MLTVAFFSGSKKPDSAGNRVDLRERADAEQAHAHAEEREHLRQPAPPHAHAALDVVERAAQNVPRLLVDATVLHGQQALGELRGHAEQGGQPHPEQRARASGDDGRGHADYVARADGSRQGRAQRAEARHLAGPALLVLHHVAQGARQLPELHGAQPYRQQDAAEQDEHHERHPPDEVVDSDEPIVDNAEKAFHQFPPRYKHVRAISANPVHGRGTLEDICGKKGRRVRATSCSFALSFCLRVSAMRPSAIRLAPSAPDDRDSPEAPPRPVSCDPGRINGVML